MDQVYLRMKIVVCSTSVNWRKESFEEPGLKRDSAQPLFIANRMTRKGKFNSMWQVDYFTDPEAGMVHVFVVSALVVGKQNEFIAYFETKRIILTFNSNNK